MRTRSLLAFCKWTWAHEVAYDSSCHSFRLQSMASTCKLIHAVSVGNGQWRFVIHGSPNLVVTANWVFNALVWCSWRPDTGYQPLHLPPVDQIHMNPDDMPAGLLTGSNCCQRLAPSSKLWTMDDYGWLLSTNHGRPLTIHRGRHHRVAISEKTLACCHGNLFMTELFGGTAWDPADHQRQQIGRAWAHIIWTS